MAIYDLKTLNRHIYALITKYYYLRPNKLMLKFVKTYNSLKFHNFTSSLSKYQYDMSYLWLPIPSVESYPDQSIVIPSKCQDKKIIKNMPTKSSSDPPIVIEIDEPYKQFIL